MRQLFPIPPDDVDPSVAYANDERPGARWLMLNMIGSLDGATAIEGRSGQLGGAADKDVFRAIRAVADVILVGAGTLRDENYGPPTVDARLAIVSGSLDFDSSARVFSGGYRPIVVTHAATDPSRRAAVGEIADVMVCGDSQVDLGAALARFDGVVLCEGGPSLNGELVAQGLVDELCLTIAPLLVGGDSSRIARASVAGVRQGMRLERILEADGFLFCRYVRARD